MSLITVYYDPIITLGRFLDRTRYAESTDDRLGLSSLRQTFWSENPIFWNCLVVTPMHNVVKNERFTRLALELGYLFKPFKYIPCETLVTVVTVEGLLRRCQVYTQFKESLVEYERSHLETSNSADLEKSLNRRVSEFLGSQVEDLVKYSDKSEFYLDWFCEFGIVIVGLTTVKW